MNIYYFFSVSLTLIIIVIYLYILYKKNKKYEIDEDDIIIEEEEEEEETKEEEKEEETKIINEQYNYLVNQINSKKKKELIKKQKELINNINDEINQSKIDIEEFNELKTKNKVDMNEVLINYQIQHQDNLDKMNSFYKNNTDLDKHEVSTQFKLNFLNNYIKLIETTKDYPEIYKIVLKEYNYGVAIYDKIYKNELNAIDIIKDYEIERINKNKNKIKTYNNSVDKLKKLMKTHEENYI